MSKSTRMGEGEAAVCDLCNGIGYLGENECPRCNTAVGESDSPPDSADLVRFHAALSAALDRDDCVCGGPKGHTGWLVCLDKWRDHG